MLYGEGTIKDIALEQVGYQFVWLKIDIRNNIEVELHAIMVWWRLAIIPVTWEEK